MPNLFRNKLNSTRGMISRREAIIITIIVLEVIFFIVLGSNWMKIRAQRGDDTFACNTAKSVATINSSNGQNCVVGDCGKTASSGCPHYNGDGYIGYFDNVSNTIVATPPRGYNEYTNMKVGGHEYNGERGTMVIQVEARGDQIILSWVSDGKNHKEVSAY